MMRPLPHHALNVLSVNILARLSSSVPTAQRDIPILTKTRRHRVTMLKTHALQKGLTRRVCTMRVVGLRNRMLRLLRPMLLLKRRAEPSSSVLIEQPVKLRVKL
jgi:hypothetical protein